MSLARISCRGADVRGWRLSNLARQASGGKPWGRRYQRSSRLGRGGLRSYAHSPGGPNLVSGRPVAEERRNPSAALRRCAAPAPAAAGATPGVSCGGERRGRDRGDPGGGCAAGMGRFRCGSRDMAPVRQGKDAVEG